MFTKAQKRDLDEMGQYAQPGSDYPDNLPARFHERTKLEFPTGELARGDLVSFCLAVRCEKRGYRHEPIERRDRFNAQGLEGKIVVEDEYYSLLTLALSLTPYRFQIGARIA